MRREELRHVARAAADLTGSTRILVLGSQAVLGSFSESELPDGATRSVEADIVVWDPLVPDTAVSIDANLGMSSPFHSQNGYFADGMTLAEVSLPHGWEGRVRELEAHRATQPDAPVHVYCPEIHDLCASKLARSDTKDVDFVAALLLSELIDRQVLEERVQSLPGEATHTVALRGLQKVMSRATDEPFAPLPEPDRSMSARLVVRRARRQCAGTTDDDQPCRNLAMLGTTRCRLH